MRFQLTKQHILAAADLTINHAYATSALVIQGLVFIFGIARYQATPERIVPFLLSTTVVFIVFFLPLYLLARRRFIKLYTTLPEFAKPMDAEIVNGELVLKSEKSSTSIPRNWIIKVKANQHVTLLYKSPHHCHVIPAEVITANEDIRAYVENKPPAAA